MLDIKKSFMILKELKAFLKPDLHKPMFKAVKWKTTGNEDEINLDTVPKSGKMIIDIKLLEEETQ